MVTSIVLLIILIINYCLVPKLIDLFGKALMCLSVCLIAQYCCYIIDYMGFFEESLKGKLKILMAKFLLEIISSVDLFKHHFISFL
jgi:hypothetical protein